MKKRKREDNYYSPVWLFSKVLYSPIMTWQHYILMYSMWPCQMTLLMRIRTVFDQQTIAKISHDCRSRLRTICCQSCSCLIHLSKVKPTRAYGEHPQEFQFNCIMPWLYMVCYNTSRQVCMQLTVTNTYRILSMTLFLSIFLWYIYATHMPSISMAGVVSYCQLSNIGCELTLVVSYWPRLPKPLYLCLSYPPQAH